MSKIFEDEFMELQSGLIELCLEALDGIKADKIFAYASMEKHVTSFDAFFEIKGKIKEKHEIGLPDDIQLALLDEGMADLRKIRKVCEKYERPCPTEMKMCYDVKTGKYEASYKYDPVCGAETGICSDDIFDAWVDEMKKDEKKDEKNSKWKKWFGRG